MRTFNDSSTVTFNTVIKNGQVRAGYFTQATLTNFLATGWTQVNNNANAQSVINAQGQVIGSTTTSTDYTPWLIGGGILLFILMDK